MLTLGPGIAQFGANWGATPAVNAKKIAIVDGISWFEKWAFSYGNAISISAYASQLEDAGHTVIQSKRPNEQQLVNLLNQNEIVIVRWTPKTGQPYKV